MQVDALYTCDTHGHLVRIREPNGGLAPRFFFGRTREGNLWRVRHDLPESMKRRLVQLASQEPVTQDLRAVPRNLAAFLVALGDTLSDEPGHFGPAYRFPDAIAPASGTTRITPATVHLIEHMGPGWETFGQELPEREPCWAVVQDGQAVSVCFSARLSDVAAEAGVETREEYRGRGLACAVVSAWASSVRETGRTPLYSTWWDNLASQAVARKLELVQYAVDLSL